MTFCGLRPKATSCGSIWIARTCYAGRVSALLERLDPEQFMGHRSHTLEELGLNGYGGFTATLFDGTELNVSRTYAGQVKEYIV